MSLAYRAIWQDDRADLVDIGFEAFAAWAAGKHGIELPRSGDVAEQVSSQKPGTEVSAQVLEAADADLRAVVAKLREDTGSERWVSTLTVMESDNGGWIWVDVERVAENIWHRIEAAPPRFAVELIRSGRAEGGDPRWGEIRLEGTALAVPVGEAQRQCVNLIRSPKRECPIVVFAHDYLAGAEATMKRADEASRQLGGIAPVRVLPEQVLGEFNAAMGDDLGLAPGQARVYLPGQELSHFHRIIEASVARRPWGAGRRAARLLLPVVATRRAPKAYDRLRRMMRSAPGRSDQDLLQLAEQEIGELELERDDANQRIRALEDDKLDHLSEIELLQAKVASLQQALTHRSNPDATGSIPTEVDDVSDAVHQARRHLPNIVIPPAAERDLEKLDRAVEQQAWGNTTWQGLRALDAYAADPDVVPGGFFEWCKSSGHAFSWTPSPKKLAMKESDTVMNNERYRVRRMLPVDKAVDASGKLEMCAHLKISEGGGPLAPRVYFHDDTGGTTGKVHVGYIGPHEHMPNGSTN